MEKLFEALQSSGQYTKSFSDFQSQFGSPEGQEKLYGALKESGSYTKSMNDFTSQFFNTPAPVKTNDSASADPAVESNQNAMGSQSEKPLSAWQSIKNSFSNVGEQVGDVFEFWFDTNEEEGGGARASLDIATNTVYAGIFGQDKVDEYVKKHGEDSWMAQGLGTKSTLESIEKYKKEQLESKDTLGIIESVKKGDVSGALAGGVNALTSMIGSVIYGAGTLGTGFFMDYTAENFVEYNKLKAENLGVSFDELVQSGEADNAIPVGMGVISTGLEFIGLGTVAKGVKGAVKGTGSTGLVGMGSKYLAQKLIYNKGARNTMRMFSTGATEFTTEILQHAADKVNVEYGRVAGTDNEAEVFKTVIDAVTSQEGLEAGLQGFIGGGGMVAGSYSAKSMNTIRTVVDGDKIDKNINELSVLRKKFNTTDNKLVKEGIQSQINEKESEIADSVRKGNDIYNSLDDKQISKIESLTDLADAAAFKTTELNKQFRKNEISESQYASAMEGFKSEYDGARQQLIDMNLEQNIESAKTIAKEKGLEMDVFTTAEVESLMNSDKVSEETRKTYFDNKDNGFDVSAFAIGNKIVIDKDIARKTGSINAGMHEVLHPVLNKLIGGVKEQGKMVRQFRKSMTSSQRNFVDAKMKERGYTGKAYNTEYVNVFSDALRKKQINYDKTAFEKIGDAVVGLFKPVGYTNIGFESGKDVYNFIKEFDQSAEQGKLTSKAAAALKDVDLSDAGLQDGIEFSKTVEEAELDYENAQNADPNDPRFEANLEAAEAALDAAEEAAANPQAAIKATPKPKAKPKVKKERPVKPTRTTDLGPRDPLSQKIMDQYNVGMYGIERKEYTASKPLPAPVERKLVPMFEGYINTIVQQKFKQFAPEALEFQDALAILRAEVIAAIRTYNPAKNKDLAGYVKKIVQTRQSLMFKEANKEFTSDISDAKGVIATKDTQSIDRSGNVERGQRTFNELDIVDQDLIDDIKSDLEKEIRVRVQKGTLSETVSVKKGRDTYIVSWLENYVNKQLFKKLMKKTGAITGVYPNAVIPGAYIDFLNDPNTFDIVTKALPIKSIKKSYGKLFPTERVGRELTAEGNPVFRIKPIDKKAFLTYFVKGKKSAVLERQKQLFREILEPLAKQVVADYATTENLSELKSIQELAPDTSLDVQADIIIEAQLNDLQSQLDRYKGEKTSFDIIQFSKTVTKDQKQNIFNALNPLSEKESTNDFQKTVVEDILNGINKVKTFQDLAELVWNAGNDTLNKNGVRTYRAELLKLLANKLNYTDTVKFLISAINKHQTVYKYQQKVIGFDYSLANLKSSLNDVKGIEAKADVAELFLKYISRSIRTLKLDGITRNSQVYDKILTPILGDPKKYGFSLEVDEEKNRSYILRDIKTADGTVESIRLQGLTDVTRIKADFVNNVKTINEEAVEVREWLLSEAIKAKINGNGDSFIGFLSLISADQRGVIRKMNSAGFAMEGLKVKDSILEHETEAVQVFQAWKNFVEGNLDKTQLTNFLEEAKVNLVSRELDALLRKVQKETGARGKKRYADPRVKEFLNNKKIIQFSKTKYSWDPFDMADVVTMSLFGKTKAFQNREAYMRTYKYLTPAQQAEVRAEMKKHKLLQFSKTLNKAKAMVNRPDAPQKGISVWDFDDTLATTKSNVLYTLPDGTKGKINATEFALQADQLAAKGAEFDFSEFSKVMQGAKGPMFDKAIARNKKFGNSNVYILTARPANSKYAIHEFLKGIGLDIKLENIVGLGDGTALAKAQWVIDKVAEGYNDFYFADDAYKNVKAVQGVLEEADVKSKVHQAKVQFSKDINKDFNKIIEDVTGIGATTKIFEAASKVIGKTKDKFKFFVPYSAEDFVGLLYPLMGEGKKGDAHAAWFKKALLDPYAKGYRDFESYKENATGIVKELIKSFKDVPSGLEKTNSTGFTNEMALRVILWAKNGHAIPGLSKQERSDLIKIVQGNPELLRFAKQIQATLGGYPEPTSNWYSGTITTDAIGMINTTKRAEFLEAWQQNADVIFSKDNMNKLRLQFGENYTEALEDILYRMKTGRNRPIGANKLTNNFMNWVNDSVGTIMFFNTRSALLQTLSIVNFVNWGDNNPIAAAEAFADQDQFWKDFSMLFNSDFLKQRRSGLKNDVNADDIARAAETATNKYKAALSAVLKAGFLPTQIADSFAIAMGGASFIRNRINKYKADGMSEAAAKEKAFLDFQEIAEETQQSSRPDRVSQQQASPLGRIILAFANTPMQYMRLTKKAVLDLKNGRGDYKTNITKIVYYTTVQNMIFSSLQSAMFAALFEDDDEEMIDDKQLRAANSMLDSLLRGTGVYGAIASTIKNILFEINKQSNKDRPDYTQAGLRMLSISPPVDSKIRKVLSTGRAFSYKTTREKMKGFGLDNPAYYAVGQSISAFTNIPIDRVVRKLDNLRVVFSDETKYWQKVALLLGYSQWDLGLVQKKESKNKFGKTSKWKKRGSSGSKWKKRN